MSHSKVLSRQATNPSQRTKLTRKQAAFVKELIDNPKLSATQAALRTYGSPDKPTTYATARDIAASNLAKPYIQAVLHDHALEAEMTIVKHMKQDDDARLSFDAARDIQDRVHGKATQRVEATSTGVSITIDLTGMMLDNGDTEHSDTTTTSASP